MSADHVRTGWQRWREAVFATCTVWLVLQNIALLAVVVWGNPASALAAGAAVAKTALTLGGQLGMLMLAVALGLALAAYLVHAPSGQGARDGQEVDDAR
jgi:hypothetical protein